MKKYYSVSEAEAMIPKMKEKMVDLMKLSKAIDLLDSIDIQYDDEYETIKRDVLMNKKFHEFSLRFCKEVEKLLGQGIVLKDIDQGLVNFFSMHAGKEVFLCWKMGEDKIQHWYELDSSYEFKKTVDELKGKKKRI
ncbi:DUF2203 family protein [Candidatus Woesearchaeota archaeon]|nr:DUF2203 family protein [Candidatus Woesearchaeota archaeon]